MEVTKLIHSHNKALVRQVYQNDGTWTAVNVLVGMVGYIEAERILGITKGYIWHLVNNDQRPRKESTRQKIDYRLREWLGINEHVLKTGG